jgi:protocatechuate 3,4-dioxygenase, beta subunit
VHGRVLDGAGRPLQDTLVEIWQANAAGRYRHEGDTHPAPLDPYFSGAGWCSTDAEGRYRFVTIKPGAYPWRNHANAWRPPHIHFSLLGRTFSQRLITQMYFQGDPLLKHDPIWHAVADPAARRRLVSVFDPAETVPDWALAYRFDVTLGGRDQTPPVDQ